MKTNKIFKIITFILLSSVLLVLLSGTSKAEAKELEVDTSFNDTLASINTILERNEKYESVDKVIKNINFNATSHTQHVFCRENNDNQITTNRNNRVNRVLNLINLHRVNFLNANFNLL